MSASRVFVGLGSNLGDRLEYLKAAVAALRSSSAVEVVRTSSVYETKPVGGPEQPLFLNAVAELRTDLGPRDLLRRLQAIETEVGRTPGEPWGPREIDLDLLLFGTEVLDEDGLEVPHPGDDAPGVRPRPVVGDRPGDHDPRRGRGPHARHDARPGRGRLAFPPHLL